MNRHPRTFRSLDGHVAILFILALMVLGGCAAETDDVLPITKAEARLSNGFDEAGNDLCSDQGWYEDGVCDAFCPAPDGSDCGDVVDPCDEAGYYNDGVCDSYCSNDPDCGVTPPGECGGPLDVDCGADQYCHLFAGQTCGGSGVCLPTPNICTDEWDPVCGCDGQTYGNPCEALASGANIESRGECAPHGFECGGELDVACPAGTFCQVANGEVCGGLGFCEATPEFCTEQYDPVCGCDGQTYGNDCEAAAQGVNVVHRGECAPAGFNCGGELDVACPPGTYCQALEDPNAEQICGARGTCEPTPQACPDIWAPVCGCDGQTYGNDCEAAAHGVNVTHDSACEDPGNQCGGFPGLTCAAGEVCIYPDNTCNIADLMGTCEPATNGCPENYDPVCGCNGQTYGNRCEATAAGASVLHAGACGSTTCPDGDPNCVICEDDAQCDADGTVIP